ncbi:TrmH family RNA methyltransferase [Mediterraneibacter gnavus]|uniref:TrmH family RNA methyltransferase n=1 Tax=Mediterraneibacter gnavus TaxID=33038 RepID=UPI0036F37F8F
MITSTSNQRIKELSQIQKKSKVRSREGVFVAEGIRMVRETPYERLVSLYFSESFEKKYGNEVLDAISGGDLKIREQIRRKTEILSDAVFSYVSDTKTPQGVLAVVRQMEYTLEQMTDGVIPHLMILDNLQDPGNLGTIFRTAEATGVTGIIMSRDCVDIYNPKTIRSTMGALYRMPFVYVEDLRETIHTLKEKNIKSYAAHLDGKNTYDKEDYRQGTAFLIGNEGNGLREEIAQCADTWIRIPMCGQVESLNAAVAATVLMFEVSRQRRG